MARKNAPNESGGDQSEPSKTPAHNDSRTYLAKLQYIILKMILAFTYDLAIQFFDLVIKTFFREVTSRGGFNIPKEGPVVFVCAPHHNQFVDPIVVMTTAKQYSNRRISLLTAAKSYNTWYVGTPAKLCNAIPVERPQDLVKPYEGTIRIENFGKGNDNLVVIGEGTQFLKNAGVKGIIGLTHFLGNAKIEKIESDTKIILLAPFKVNFDNPNPKEKELMDGLRDGHPYVLAPHIDNRQVFQNVFDHLNDGGCLGIFPEGGLHDRPNLLPLKPGVAIMALGAVAHSNDPNQVVNIVPVGLNYFHAHRFRSRVVIEYGKPIAVTKQDGENYEKNPRTVVNQMLELITLRLKEITVSCDDYETLIAIQAARRLYLSTDRESIPLPVVVEMNRRLLNGYQKFSEKEDIRQLKDAVGAYNKKLMQLGIHDHQVESLTRSNRFNLLLRFFTRLFKVIVFFCLALPGIVMFGPIFIVGNRISRAKAKKALEGSAVKIKANDVISTWKILVALGFAPLLYIFWAIVLTALLVRFNLTGKVPKPIIFILCYLWNVFTTYASLRVGEIGMDYYKSLTPLFYSLLLINKDILQIENLKKTREDLAKKVIVSCQKYGPLIFDDYGKTTKKYQKAAKPHTERQNSIVSLSNLENIAIFSEEHAPNDPDESEIETGDTEGTSSDSDDHESLAGAEENCESSIKDRTVRSRRTKTRGL